MLGYRKQMEDLMAAANPGLGRRFQMNFAFNFSDYDDSALVRANFNVASSEGGN